MSGIRDTQGEPVAISMRANRSHAARIQLNRDAALGLPEIYPEKCRTGSGSRGLAADIRTSGSGISAIADDWDRHAFSSARLAPPTFVAWSMTMLERGHRLTYRVSRSLWARADPCSLVGR